MATLGTFNKQPGETLDFDISFVDWLAARSDTILSQVTTVEAGITLVTSSVISGVVKVWLSGGANGSSYKVTSKITTNGGRVKEGEITIKVKEI